MNLDAPKDIAELRKLVAGFVPFAVMFAMVVWIWYEYNVFFRRYGMQDTWTVFLNSVLLFVVLFYVYPLKFLTVSLVGQFFMDREDIPRIAVADGWFVMLIYSIGVLAIFGTFSLLHRHAWRRRAAMDLTRSEELALRFSLRSHVMSMSLAALSLIILRIVLKLDVPLGVQYAGWVYALMGPLHAWNGYNAGAAQDALRKGASTASGTT